MTGNPTWAERSVLVTGATGMVGSALDEGARRPGCRVTALVADHDPQSELIRSGTIDRVTVVNGRLEDVGAVERGDHRQRRRHGLPSRRADHRVDRAPIAPGDLRVERAGHLERARRRPPAPDAREERRGRVERQGLRREPGAARTPKTMPLAGTFPYEVSKSMTDLVARSYARHLRRAGRRSPAAATSTAPATSTGAASCRARSGRSSATSNRCCAATARSSATTCTSTMSSTRISRWSTRPTTNPGRGLQLQRRVARDGARHLRGVLRRGGRSRARAEDPRPGGRRDQRPVPRLVARALGAAAGGPRSASPTVWPERSPGTRTSLGSQR